MQNQVEISNQDCSSAQPVQVSDGFPNDVFVSSEQFATSSIAASGCSAGDKDAWYSFVAPECGAVQYFFFDPNALGSIYEGTCGSLQLIECFKGDGSTTNLTPGQTYFMQFLNDPSGPYASYLYIQPFIGPSTLLTNTECSSADPINVNQNYPNIDLLSVPLLPINGCDGDVIAREVWYSFTAPAQGKIKIISNGAQAEVYSGSCGSLTQEPCTSTGVFDNLTGGSSYFLRLLFDGDYTSTNFSVEIEVPTNGQICSDPLVATVSNSSCASYISYTLNSSYKTDPCTNTANLWVSFVAPTSGSIRIECVDNNYFYNLYNDDCSSLNKITSYSGNDDIHYVNGLTSGQSYLLSIGKGAVSTPIDFCIQTNNVTASNGSCNAAQSVATNTGILYEEGKSVIDVDNTNSSCEDDVASLWYSFTASSADMIFQGSANTHLLYSGSCGSLTEIPEVEFDSDFIYENLTVGNTYYLQILTGSVDDINASSTIDISDYTKSYSGYENCSQSLPIFLTDVPVPYDLGIANTLSGTALPSCISSGSGLTDSWATFDAINTGLYISGISSTESYVLYNGSCGSLTEVDCYTSAENDFIQFGGLVPANTYYLRKISSDGANSTISIAASSPAFNGDCEAAISVEVALEGNASIAMKSSDAVSFNTTGSCDSKASLWYEFTAPVGGNVILQEHIGGVAIYEGTCGSLSEVICETATASSSLEISLTPGTTYLLRLSFDDYNDNDRSFVLIEGASTLPDTDCDQAPLLSLSDMSCNMSVTSTTNGVVNSIGNFCSGNQKQAVYYSFTSSDDAVHRFELTNTPADHTIILFENCSLSTPVACGGSPLDVSLLNGSSFIVAVYPQVMDVTSDFTLCVNIPPNVSDGNVGVDVVNPQVKLDVNGGIRPGFTTNTQPGVIRWNNDLEVYDGTAWKSLSEWDYTAEEDVNMQNNRIVNVQNPVLPTDVATKDYVDQFPNNDNSPSNEIQTQTLVEDTLKMSLGGGFVVFDAFYDNEFNTEFSLTPDNTLSIGDLGDTMTLSLTKYDNGWLYNTTTEELTYTEANIGIFDSDPSQPLSVTGNVRSSNTEAETNYIEMNHDGSDGNLNVNGSGNLSLQHGGDTKMSVISSGNVGIDDESPDAKLSVTGVIRSSDTDAETNHLEVAHDGAQGILNKSGTGNLVLQHDSDTKATILPNGNMGVGIENPLSEMTVVGTITAKNGEFTTHRTEILHDGSNGILNTRGNGDLILSHDEDAKVVIKDNGNVGIADDDPSSPLNVVGKITTSFLADEIERMEINHTGAHGRINKTGDGNIQFAHDGSPRLVIEPDSNTGIKDENPSQSLSVTGTIRASLSHNEFEYLEVSHDSNNGIINTQGDGNIQFRHDNLARMTLTDDGHLGIGTTTPDEELSVIGVVRAASSVDELKRTEMSHDGTNGIIDAFGSDNLNFQVTTDTKMTIKDNGNVGIGVIDPSDKLHVSSAVGEDALRVQVGIDTKLRIFDNGSISMGTNNTNITDNNVYVHTNLGISDSNPSQKLSVTGTVRASQNQNEIEHTEIKHDGTHGILNTEGDGNLLIQHDDITRMTIEPGGDIGIGTTDPSEKLDVRGTTQVRMNSGSTAPHLQLLETQNADGARINFGNTTETLNSWTLWGKADDTAADNTFNIFNTDNGNIVTVKGDGRLGINDGSPDYTLDVEAIGGINPFRVGTSDVNDNFLKIIADGKVGMGVTTPSDRFHLSSDAGENAFRVQVGNGTKFRIFENGSISLGSNNGSITDNNVYIATNLGISDSNPSQKLSVTGTVRASNNQNELEHTEIKHNGANGIINTVGDGDLELQHDGLTKVRIESGGNVGIGVSDAESRLHVNGSIINGTTALQVAVGGTSKMKVYANGSVTLGGDNSNVTSNDVYIADRLGLGYAAPIYRIDIPNTASNGSGRGRANAWVTYSDKRVKKKVSPLNYGLDEVLRLNPKKYNHHTSTFENGKLILNDDYSQDIGFLAQDVAEIIKEIVSKPENESSDLWSMNYEKLTPVLVNAIKEQQEQIESQNSLLQEQQALIENLLKNQIELKASLEEIEEKISIKN